MDPISALGIASSIIQVVSVAATFISESLSLSHEPSKLYDTTSSWKPLLGAGQNFLEIFDIPFSPGEPAKLLLKATDINNVDDTLNILPTQEIHTVRVYFVENLGVHGERSPIATPSFAGSPAMISQWGLSAKKLRWETHSYRLSLEPTLEGAMVEPGKYPYIDSISIATGTIRRTLRCTIISIEDGRIIFHVDATSMIQELDLLFDQGHLKGNKAERPSSEAAYAYHSQFCESLRRPIETYPILGAQVTPASGLKQLLLLRYSHALVEEYYYQVYGLQANYARRKEGLSDPRRVTLTIPMLAEITRDACFYEEVNERATELAGAVDALVESLKFTHYRWRQLSQVPMPRRRASMDLYRLEKDHGDTVNYARKSPEALRTLSGHARGAERPPTKHFSKHISTSLSCLWFTQYAD